MVVGIINENAIFTYIQVSTSHKKMNKVNSIIYAISTRLRPKIMTATSTMIALMPLALGTGTGTGALLHQPLAIAVIGGVLVALPLLIMVLPTLLNLLAFKEEVKNKKAV
ncbi:AcrB/AcrD/AcrF family protein [Arachidicoccus rhizosphaerae]|jgi:multidrug efflux pump subunit AcrB|uniref:AcrB/AcrD/AcrF family protein n=2 Tax=Arachidicoccus rhizosphaerae TaxID=551991 RepID=A0A1H4BFX8_9BACT|nr:AcrB/AcrD/AcrF family protein [Arachidicoccus rhizosphaerae]